MNKQKSLVGMEIDFTTHLIEAGALRQLNRALSHPDPYALPETTIVPIMEAYESFPCFLLGNLMDLPRVYRTLGLNIKNVLLSRDSVITHRKLNVGDRVEVRTFLTNIYEQQASGNPIGFAVLESVGLVAKDVVFVNERILAVRGGFQRGGRS